MSDITPEEDALMRSLYRQVEESGIGIEPWTDQELEEHLEQFKAKLRQMHEDPAEGARIDSIVADAAGLRSIQGEVLLERLTAPPAPAGWSQPDPWTGRSHWIPHWGRPACGRGIYYSGDRYEEPPAEACEECTEVSRALDGRHCLASVGRNWHMGRTVGMRDKQHLSEISGLEVSPMSEDEVLSALAFLSRMSDWERLEISRAAGGLYGGYCVEYRGGPMTHVPAVLAGPERHPVIMLLKALIDQSGDWR